MRLSKLFAAGIAILFSTSFFSASNAADTLKVAHYDQPAQMGMPYGTFGANGAYQLYAIFDGLTFVDDDKKVYPRLATEWKLKDSNTWIVKLRKGVTFHNGVPWNADAMLGNVDAINNDPVVTKQQARRQLATIVGGKKIDDYTVELTTKVPDPVLPKRLHIMRPHEPKAWADLGPKGYSREPVGTGSYKIVKWGNDGLKMTAFENAWRKPKTKNVEITIIPEIATRVQALNSGQVHIAWALDTGAMPIVEAGGNKVVVSRRHDTLNLILHHRKEGSPVKDVRVRRALNYAYDKETFVKEVMGGMTKTNGQPADSSATGYFPDIKPYPYDPAKAKKLLAEAGYPNGFDMKIEMVVASGEFGDTFQAMAADFKKVGVNAELVVLTIPIFVKKILKQQPWEGDAFTMMFESHPIADLTRVMATHSCNFFAKHICFEEMKETIAAMDSEFDQEKRLKLMKKVAQFYHDQAPVVFSHERPAIDGLSPKVKGYKLVNRVPNWHQITID
ncbi:MAG: Periplasmic dipeptide transport protein [Alphaproteobacteria bacterium MarineAlpha2_Bin1]|nr:MAG: Periplasmic dipeptide transport protein [Alphaproteobacteria bacterium MarineAlpha2_Bin1]